MHPWAHVISSYRGQWIPGDARGFRSREHRIHSSGDYRNPPPEQEHAGLRAYARSISSGVVRLSRGQFERLGQELVSKLESMQVPLAILAADAVHCHALLRVGEADAKHDFGRAKQASSFALRVEVPGKLWGGSSRVTRVGGLKHFLTVADYIHRHASRGAWVWVREDVMQELMEVRRQDSARSGASKTQPRRHSGDTPSEGSYAWRHDSERNGPP